MLTKVTHVGYQSRIARGVQPTDKTNTHWLPTQ